MAKAARQSKEPLYEQIASFAGAHARHTCPNCSWEYQIGFRPPGQGAPRAIRCPNCRWEEQVTATMAAPLKPTIGDRITVFGWPYDLATANLGPRRWDVVVFKNPELPDMNYIKRLVGLPGEKVELIDGDLFVNDQIQRKTASAQESLWFPVYHHDYPPNEPAGNFQPRFLPGQADNGWRDLETRRPTFAADGEQRGEIYFATNVALSEHPPQIADVYGYNPVLLQMPRGLFNARAESPDRPVSDVRLSATASAFSGDGHLEFAIRKYDTRVTARFYPGDGRIVLAGQVGEDAEPEVWATVDHGLAPGSRLALSVVDYQARVLVDGEVVARSTDLQYSITPEKARRRMLGPTYPTITLAATDVDVALRALQIERDVYYRMVGNEYLRAVPGRPVQLREDEYFVLGDNSPNSADGRIWDAAGPHLAGTAYTIGTVPRSQLMGRAFFVYWPGFLPLPGGQWTIVPDLGRVRWIH